ncbi:hypothetical protein O0I10_002423 [Lichtheimia ornata]|uniref:Chromo domain-containing protein n=1 Tax=Lichtheimia ornata TaxID=688661 RepID=A0AAD7VCB7_9FUNG|nr:uncharacterized protein O0I10_002423 [Lichtheimia ornata]KAJ8661616.1 hypothetical protein O0I10_002423 [Lichtheimia ornata]
MAPMKRRNAMIPKPRRARELASMRRRNSAKAVDLVSESESESGSESDEQEDEGVYEVERIVDHRMSRRYPGTKEYLIKWKNYDEDSNTWENEKNVFSEDLMKKYWDEKNKERNNKKRSTATSSSMKKKRKQERDNDSKVEVSIHPPSGLEWEDAKRVVHIFADKTSELFGRVEWPDDQTTLYRTSILRDEIPGLLIDFYEKHLAFAETK